MLNHLGYKSLGAIAIALLALITVGFLLLNRQLVRSTEYDILQAYSREVRQIAANLNTYTNGLEDTLLSLLCDTRLQESINRPLMDETLENQLAEIRTLREVVSYVEGNRQVDRVRLYLSDEKMLARECVNFFSHTDALSTPEYQAMDGKRMFLHWMGEHRVQTPYTDDEYVTLGLRYRTNFLSESRNWALILLDISPKVFTQALEQAASSFPGAQAVILNSTGAVMVGTDQPETLSAFPMNGTQEGFFDCGGKEYAYICQPISAENWSMFVTLPRESLRSSQQVLFSVILFVLGLLIIALLALICIILYSRSIRRYINALNESLQQSGNAETTSIPSHRALFNLDRNIAYLLETNRRLTANKLEAQLRERDVTLQALQAQINPHFLYNTLDAINWMAIREQAGDVSEAITTLADYFRLSLSHGRSIVTLQEDAEITRKYLALYKHRYDYTYAVEWLLPPESLSCLLPKLTLQPLVENALRHGIFMRDQKEGGKLTIRSFVEDGHLTLIVQDNGPGLKGGMDEKKGFGLENVRRRLDLYYNNRYSLELNSLPEGGVQVIVCIA
ncbi:MAG: sensor histidine kinase [Clostridiales bacterium]|nr:sensor histidine kinase [Clostridiales bacterium]